MSTYDMLDHGPAPGGDEDTVMRDLGHMIVDQIWWVIGIAASIILAAVIYTKVATPIYSADALLQVDTSSANNGSQQSNTMASLVPPQNALRTDAEIEIIKSRAVVEPVVEQFKLNFSTKEKTMPVIGKITSWFATPGHPIGAFLGMRSYAWGGERFDVDSITVPKTLEGAQLTLRALGNNEYELLDPFGEKLLTGTAGTTATGNGVTIDVKTLAARAGTEFYVTRANQLDAVAGLSQGLQVSEKGRETGVVQLSYLGSDPRMITGIVNAVAASYLQQRTVRAQEEATNMLTFLNSELPRLRAEVRKAEVALSDYQKHAGSFQPTQEAGAYLSGGLDYERQIAALRIQRIQLAQRFTDQSREVQQIDAQIASLSKEKARLDQQFAGLPTNEREAVSLQRNAKVSQDIYVALLNKIQELSISRAGTVSNVHIIDQALLPSSPVRPKAALIISAGTVLGIIAGIAFAFCRRTFFTGVSDPEFVERRFQLPIFGSIPYSVEQAKNDQMLAAGRVAALPGNSGVKALPGLSALPSSISDSITRMVKPDSVSRNDSNEPSLSPAARAKSSQRRVRKGTQSVLPASTRGTLRPLLAKTHPYENSVEGLRGLRATLQFGLIDAPNRVVAFTSPAPSDGKSFLCANLATLIAESGKRVLLIDADLRRGRLAQYLGRSPQGGLTELLTGQIDIETVAQETGVDGLHFIGAGAFPPNPSEILSSPRFAEALERFEAAFDLVIVDTPPLLAVADAAIVAHLAGSTVMVMRAGAHNERNLSEALKKLRRARARVIGGVMNAVPLKTGTRYGSYDYAYAYSYSSADPVQGETTTPR